MDVRRWFDTVDRDRSGKIDAKELQAALQLGNLNFSLQAVAMMIRLHDQDRSGEIDFNEFQSLHNFLMSMQQSYQHYDRNRDNALDRGEVYQALQQAGFRLDQHAFEALFTAFDPDRSQGLSLTEYMGMTCFLQMTSHMFGGFDPHRTGRIQLDFNQWVYACANCR